MCPMIGDTQLHGVKVLLYFMKVSLEISEFSHKLARKMLLFQKQNVLFELPTLLS